MSGQLVHLDIGDTTLRLAVTYVLERAGYGRARDREAAELLVADRHHLDDGRPVDTLVIDPAPAACQRALEAIASGTARAAVCADDLHRLPDALHAATLGTVTVPARIVTEANRVPRLPARLTRTLRLVLAGHTNQAIARQLHESESTTKRDVAALLRLFDVPNRVALTAAARNAGYTEYA